MKFRQFDFKSTILLGLFAYTALVFIWGCLYYMFEGVKYSGVSTNTPGFWETVYFSCVSFGTIGYGDMIPSGIGQIIVWLESMTSILFIAIFGGRITYLFLKRPDNIIITENLHIRPLDKDVLFSVRIGNKGQTLVDCKLDVDILQIRDNIKKIIHKETFVSALLEYSWRPALTLNKPENSLFLKSFKQFYSQPESSLIRITMRGSDIATGEVVATYKYYKVQDVKISGDYLPLYNWVGFERTPPVWANNNKTFEATKEGVHLANTLLEL